MTHYRFIIFVTFLMLSGIAWGSHDIQPSGSSADMSRQVDLLLTAARNGDRATLHTLVASGIDIDAMGGFWCGTALYHAVQDDDANAVSVLLECGADANKGDTDGRTPLHAATSSESWHALQIVQLLIAHGANVNARIGTGHQDDGTLLDAGNTPLHNAASISLLDDDLEVISNRAVVELLLLHGAHVNAQDAFGCTPLYCAWFSSSLDVMELLLKYGADPNIKNTEDGGTILHDVSYDGWLEAVQLLIAHGANIHSRDYDGETPLHRAALRRHMDIVSFLVSHGADIHAASKRNETPQSFLDEPNDTEPILLSANDRGAVTLIVTNGLAIRMKLKSESIDYDTIWFPSQSDIAELDSSLQSWITKGEYREQGGRIEPNCILDDVNQYNREYAGYLKDGIKHVICNLVHTNPDIPLESPPRNGFSGIMDGGCAQVVVVFDAGTQEVAWFRCNGM